MSTYSEIFGEEPVVTKSQRTKMRILEAAAECYAFDEVSSINMQSIAKRAGVTRPLILRYFETQENIFVLMATMIRVEYQKYVVQRVQAAKTPRDMVEQYIVASLDWPSTNPVHTLAWTVFLAEATRVPRLKELNTQFVRAGTQRIQALLTALGVPTPTIPFSARTLQMVLTGAILSMVTEKYEKKEMRALQDEITQQCLKLVEGWLPTRLNKGNDS